MPELYVKGLVFPQEFEAFDPHQDYVTQLRAPFIEGALQVGLLPDELWNAAKDNIIVVKPRCVRGIEVFREDEEPFAVQWSDDGSVYRTPIFDTLVDSLVFTEGANACGFLTVRAPCTESIEMMEPSSGVEGLALLVNRLVSHCVQRY